MNARRKTQNISLQPVEWTALRKIAIDEERGNISAAVVRMLDERMRREYGPRWSEYFTELPKSESETALVS